MAETITLFGKKIPKTAAIGAGALTVGMVGYAWWSRGSSSLDEEAVAEPELPEPVEVPTDTPGFGASSGSTDPMTNAEWSELAIQRLMAIGLDAAAVSSALGKFLARRPLTAVERDLVQQAIRSAGSPPVGGPWIVIDTPLPTPVAAATPPGPIRNLMASTSRTQMLARWNAPNTGGPVAHYIVEFYGGKKGGGTSTTSIHTTTQTNQKSAPNLMPAHSYGARVTAVGVNQKRSPVVSVVRTTMK